MPKKLIILATLIMILIMATPTLAVDLSQVQLGALLWTKSNGNKPTLYNMGQTDNGTIFCIFTETDADNLRQVSGYKDGMVTYTANISTFHTYLINQPVYNNYLYYAESVGVNFNVKRMNLDNGSSVIVYSNVPNLQHPSFGFMTTSISPSERLFKTEYKDNYAYLYEWLGGSWIEKFRMAYCGNYSVTGLCVDNQYASVYQSNGSSGTLYNYYLNTGASAGSTQIQIVVTQSIKGFYSGITDGDRFIIGHDQGSTYIITEFTNIFTGYKTAVQSRQPYKPGGISIIPNSNKKILITGHDMAAMTYTISVIDGYSFNSKSGNLIGNIHSATGEHWDSITFCCPFYIKSINDESIWFMVDAIKNTIHYFHLTKVSETGMIGIKTYESAKQAQIEAQNAAINALNAYNILTDSDKGLFTLYSEVITTKNKSSEAVAQTYDVTEGKTVTEIAKEARDRVAPFITKVQGDRGATCTTSTNYTIIVTTMPSTGVVISANCSGPSAAAVNVVGNRININGLTNPGIYTVDISATIGSTASQAVYSFFKL